MKFMKLGSKPDTFYSDGNVRTIASEISTDIIIKVNNVKFFLHKFPLLSKCGRLQILSSMACKAEDNTLELHDIPGDAEAFEICAKFCYGITVTISSLNVVAVRSAAEYLEMKEDVEMGNLIYKLEVFLNSCIYRSWKDSIVTLKSTKAYVPWSEDLNIVSRCIDAITCKVLFNPSKVDWNYTYSRRDVNRREGELEISATSEGTHHRRVPRDWWVGDIAELEIDLYWKVMAAIKSTGTVSHKLIGEALRVYAYCWLAGISKENIFTKSYEEDGSDTPNFSSDNEVMSRQVHLLETIVSLLPHEKGSVPCRFLLKLLRAAIVLGASSSLKLELAKRVGHQLEEASPHDLLSSVPSYDKSCYDVDLIKTILQYFVTRDQSPPSSPVSTRESYQKSRMWSAENIDLAESRKLTAATNGAKLKVAKLIDGCLVEIAKDPNLAVSTFLDLAKAIPDVARPVHDNLYLAVDRFLQEHPGLSKTERKHICQLLDCKKLSPEICLHAAQNERLPLRLVVQVLLYEQIRTTIPGGIGINELPSSLKDLISVHEGDAQDAAHSSSCDEGWEAVLQNFNLLKGDLEKMKLQLEEMEKERNSLRREITKSAKCKGLRILPSKPKCIFRRIWQSKKNASKKP